MPSEHTPDAVQALSSPSVEGQARLPTTAERLTWSIPVVCEKLGVCRRTVYNWIAAGKVEYVRTVTGSIRIFADTLWKDASAVNPNHVNNSPYPKRADQG